MANKNYINGKAREQRLKQALLKKDYDIVIRSAGSKSKIDLIAINLKRKHILFIQVKPTSMSIMQKARINNENKGFNGTFTCEFKTLSNIKEMEK